MEIFKIVESREKRKDKKDIIGYVPIDKDNIIEVLKKFSDNGFEWYSCEKIDVVKDKKIIEFCVKYNRTRMLLVGDMHVRFTKDEKEHVNYKEINIDTFFK